MIEILRFASESLWNIGVCFLFWVSLLVPLGLLAETAVRVARIWKGEDEDRADCSSCE